MQEISIITKQYSSLRIQNANSLKNITTKILEGGLKTISKEKTTPDEDTPQKKFNKKNNEPTLKKIYSTEENDLKCNLPTVKADLNIFLLNCDCSSKQFEDALEEIDFGFKYLKNKIEEIPKILNTIERIYGERNENNQDNAERNFKIRTPNPKPSAKMTFNQDQLRLYLEDKWIIPEDLYEALIIHKTKCCDYPPLHFEEDKSLFQQQYEQKKERNIDVILKINKLPIFIYKKGVENSINKIVNWSSRSFTIYPFFSKQYFEKYEKVIEEKKNYSTEKEMIELRQDFIHFYHAKLDYMYTYMISKQLNKKDYKNFKKN